MKKHHHTPKGLGFFSVLALGVNTIVGSGIFRLPADMTRALGPLSMLVFVGCAAALCLIALAYAEAASLFDSDGGAYLYAREAFGDTAGFLVGWTVWLATVLTWATVAVALPGQLAVFGHVPEKWVAALVVIGLGAVNLLGVRTAAWVSTAFAAIKIIPLALFVAIGIFYVRMEHFTPFAPVGLTQLPSAIVVAFFALSGFETAALPGGSSDRVPYAIVASLLGAALLYALIQFVAIGVTPDIAASPHPLADASSAFLGGASGVVIGIAGAVSMFGLCAAMAVTAPILSTALSRDHMLPHHSHGVAVLVGTGATLAATLLYDFSGLVGFTSVTLILQYLATCLAVPVLRRKYPDRVRVVRLPLPLLALATFGLVYLLCLCQGSEILGATVVLGAGLLISRLHRMQRAAA